MKRSIQLLMMCMAAVLLIGFNSCQQDEATISANIPGSWYIQENSTSYDPGVILKTAGNTEANDTIVRLFDGCKLSFDFDQTGVLTFPDSIGVVINYTYTVSTGAVTLKFPSAVDKSIELKVASISETDMALRMELSDITTLISVVDTTTTSTSTPSVNWLELIGTVVPAVSKVQTTVQSNIDKIDLSKLGLNPTPTLTFTLKKQ